MAHYQKAPITEAILDLRVTLPPELDALSLEAVQEGESGRYPVIQRLKKQAITVQAGEDFSANAIQQDYGITGSSTDKLQIWKAELEGFSFSRLAPYDRWETFRDEARRLWSAYQRVAKPAAVTRMALRYVNRLDLPLPFGDFKDYLRTVPEIAPDLPQGLSGYFMQCQIPQPDLDAMLILTEALVPPARPGVASVVLDIDLFRAGDTVPKEESSRWELFEHLRTKKNAIFEGCITDATRRLIG